MEKKTPLYEMHVECGGRMVPFAGYLMPVQYETGVIKEHLAVRTHAGLFDVSHMGEIICEGKDALNNLQMLLTNNFENMADGQARYSLICNEQGGIVDDLIVYKCSDRQYLMVVNASNRDKDFQWMCRHQFGEVSFRDISDYCGQLALQGPKALEILCQLTEEESIPQKYYFAKFECKVAGIPCLISRTGYTGEDGVELYFQADRAAEMWRSLLECGKEAGLIPCGLGARDTLRMEAGMPLYGHEMDDTISPLEAGLGFAVKMSKGNFIGREAIERAGDPLRRRAGLKVTGKGIIRECQDVYAGDHMIGKITSGTYAPYLGYPAGMALIETRYAEIGTEVEVDVRGRRVNVEVVPLPFYKRNK